MEISKENFLKLPETPGVYKFLKNGKPIYIGKSINLKNRLNSYLAVSLGIKTRKMVSEATSVEYIIVTSELESLLLESYLIKKYKPKYNIVLKDDKHALYIAITNEEFPRVVTLRKIDINNKYLSIFGPFPSSRNVKMILKMVRKIFPFSDHKTTLKPCIYSHIGLCNPCPNYINSLSNDDVNYLKLKNIYLDNIRNIKLVLSRRFNSVRKDLENEMLSLSIKNDYENAIKVRDKIKLLDYITQKRYSENEFLENPNLIEDIREKELNSLIKLLGAGNIKLSKLKRIECFDIAHLQGVSATASMVVLINGEKENNEYRHFKVKQKKGNSDYDSMREISKRRIRNLDKWDKPDLIIVDGGLGQVKIFDNVFKEVKIPVVGIAKHPDRIIFPDGKKVKLTGDTLNLISRIRDEAHRFARRLHHKILESKLIPS